jgi:hypothetical protein
VKAITICQPFAHLITTPQHELRGDDQVKRVENRTWKTAHRGPLLIHAGKSRDWLRPSDRASYPDLPFGALVGVAELVAVLPLHLCRRRGGYKLQQHEGRAHDLAWLEHHVHAEGPWCWILQDVRRFSPVPWRGETGLFEVPSDVALAAVRAGESVEG